MKLDKHLILAVCRHATSVRPRHTEMKVAWDKDRICF